MDSKMISVHLCTHLVGSTRLNESYSVLWGRPNMQGNGYLKASESDLWIFYFFLLGNFTRSLNGFQLTCFTSLPLPPSFGREFLS